MSVRKLNALSFQRDVLDQRGTALVEFYADWCASCKMIAPDLEQIARERADIIVGKVNVEKEPELTDRYSIITPPAVIVFKEGAVYKRIAGVYPKRDLLKWL